MITIINVDVNEPYAGLKEMSVKELREEYRACVQEIAKINSYMDFGRDSERSGEMHNFLLHRKVAIEKIMEHLGEVMDGWGYGPGDIRFDKV